MNSLIIKGTDDTPTIIFDVEAKEYKISGRSLPEDVITFYQPVLDWLSNYGKESKADFVLTVELEYFNTASSKLLLDVFMLLDENKQSTGANYKVIWKYDNEDEDMKEAGEEYADLVEIAFEFVEV